MSRSAWLKLSVVVLGVAAAAARCPDTDDDDSSPSGQQPDAAAYGPRGGSCVVPCSTVADCCHGPQCDTSIFNYACQQGRCVQLGCLGNQNCEDMPGAFCATVGNFNLCGLGCQTEAECCPPVPPGVVFPDGQDVVTVSMDGGGLATFYRCGVYPQKFMCTGRLVNPGDSGKVGVCARICSGNDDCPGIQMPASTDGGPPASPRGIRVDGGFMAIPLGDGGVMRVFQQTCMAVMGPVGQCAPGCLTDQDCCPPMLGSGCSSFGTRQVCINGACVADGCRSDQECAAQGAGAQCQAQTSAP